MAKPLEIQILARLNESLSTTEINKSLKKIAKDIGINVSIDQNELNKITKQIEQLQKKIKQQSGSTPIFDTTKSEQEIKQFEMSIDRTVKKIKDELNGLGTIKTTQFLRGEEQNLQGFIVEVKKAEGIIEKFKYIIDTSTMIDNAYPFKLDTTTIVDDTNKISQKFDEAKQKIINDLKAIQETGNVTGKQISRVMQSLQSANDLNGLSKAKQDLKELADLSKLAQQMADGREKASIKASTEERKLAESQAQSINRNIELSKQEAQEYEQWWLKALKERDIKEQQILEKEQLQQKKASDNYEQWWLKALKEREIQEQKLNESLQKQLELYKRQASINATNLTRRYGDTVDSNALRGYLKSVNELTISTPELQHQMRNLNLSFKEISANVSTSGSHMLRFKDAMTQALVKFPIWMASSTLFFQSLRFLSDGISYVDQLNKSLTQVAIVTGKTQDQVSQLGEEYQKLAYNMGVTTQDFADAAVEFYRQGLTQQEVMDRANKTIQYAKISNLDFAKSAEILTATTNSMNVSITHAADVFSFLGDATSSGADEIGVAFQKVGGSAGALNLNFEKVASWIAEISSKTRESATTVGDSIRSILARVQSLKETGFTEEGQSVNQVAKALNEVGIQLMDTQGQFRNFGTIMDELGVKWNSLDSRTKAYIATTVAGTYQQSRFLNLMEGYSDSVKLYEQSLNSAGTSQAKFDIYMQSTEAHLNRLKDAWTNVFQNTFHSDTINTGIDLLTGMANGVGNLVNVLGTLPIATGLATTAIIALNDNMRKSAMKDGEKFWIDFGSNLKQLPTIFNKVSIASKGASLAEGIFAGATEAVTIAVRGLGVAIATIGKFLAGSFLPIAGFMALSFVVEKVTGYFAEQHKQAQKLKEDEKQLSDNYKSHADEINNLADKYHQLSLEVEAGTRSKNDKEYLDVQTQIGKLLPTVVSSINATGQAHLKSASAVDKEVESLKKLSTLDSQKFVENFSDKLDKLNQKIIDTSSHIKSTNFETVGNPTGFNQGGSNPIEFKATPLSTQDQMNNIIHQRELQSLIQQRVDSFKNLSTEYQNFLGVQDTLTKSDNDYINSIINKNKANLNDVNVQKKVTSQIESTIGSLGELRGVLGNSVDLSPIAKVVTPEQLAGLSSLVKGFKSGGESVEQFTAIMKFNGYTMDQIIPIINALTDAKARDAGKTKEQVDAEASAQQTLQAVLAGTKDVQEVLNGAVSSSIGLSKEQIDENQKLIEIYSSLSQATNLTDEQSALLAQTYDELVKRFPELANGHKLNITTLMDEANANGALYQATIDSANGRLTAEQQLTLKLAQEAKNQIDILKKQVAAHRAAALEMIGIDKKGATITNNDGMLRLSNIALQNLRASDEAQKELDNVAIPNFIRTGKILAQKMGYSPTFKTPDWNFDTKGSGSKGSSGGKKPKSTADTQKVNKYQTDAFSQALAKLDLQLKESDARLNNYDKSSKEYRDELAHQISLIEQEEKLTKNQIESLNKRNDALKHQLSTMGAFNKLSNAQKQSYNDIAKAIDDNINKINDLSGAMVDYGNKVKDVQNQVLDSFSAVNDMITNNINAAMQASDDSYDNQIKKLQEKLDLMDQEYNKEERITKLRDLDQQMATVQADKRFQYIDKNGNVQLTYDKAKYDDLKKQKDELVQQYNREDAKKAVQDEIDRLQKEKDDKHKLYEQQISDMKNFWDTITKAFNNGSLTLGDFMKDFYGTSLDDLTKYAGDVGKQTDIIKQLFTDISKLSADAAKYGNGLNAGDKVNAQDAAQANDKIKNDPQFRQEQIDRTKAIIFNRLQAGEDVSRQKNYLHWLESFHEGGVVSSSPNRMTEIANKLLNSKLNPNEQIIKVLKGELLSPAVNIAQNLVPNLKMLMGSIVRPQPIPVSADNHYHFGSVEIKANNMSEFLRDIHFLTSTKKY